MQINNLIKFLTFSNFLLYSGWGLVGPIFAIFVVDQIEGGDIAMAGLAVSVNLLVRSVFQIPFGRLIDRRRGEIDDLAVLAIGSVIVTVTPFMFLLIRTPLALFALQVVIGLGWAMTSPGWLAIFTRHIDHHQEAEEWGFANATVGVGAALAGGLGGFIAEIYGFSILFVLVGLVTGLSSVFLYFVYQDLRIGEKRRLW